MFAYTWHTWHTWHGLLGAFNYHSKWLLVLPEQFKLTLANYWYLGSQREINSFGRHAQEERCGGHTVHGRQGGHEHWQQMSIYMRRGAQGEGKQMVVSDLARIFCLARSSSPATISCGGPPHSVQSRRPWVATAWSFPSLKRKEGGKQACRQCCLPWNWSLRELHNFNLIGGYM